MDVLDGLQGQRIITLTSDINQRQVDDLCRRLLELGLESAEEIRILIDSDGGDVRPALSISDLIPCIKAPVTGIVIGRCFSAANLILQACGLRMALKHAVFVLHHTSTTVKFSHHFSREKNLALFERSFLEGEDIQRKSERLIASRSSKSIEEVRKLMHDGDELDARMHAAEAKEFGLIDQILEDKGWLFVKK